MMKGIRRSTGKNHETGVRYPEDEQSWERRGIGIELNRAHRRGVQEVSANEYSTAGGRIETYHRISITVHL